MDLNPKVIPIKVEIDLLGKEAFMQKALEKALQMIRVHVQDHEAAIMNTYLRADAPLDITLKAKFAPEKNGVKIETSINFVSERIKDKAELVLDDKQMELFEP